MFQQMPSYSAPMKFDNFSSLQPNPHEKLGEGDVQFMQLKEPALASKTTSGFMTDFKTKYGVYVVIVIIGALIGCFAHLGSGFVDDQVVNRCLQSGSSFQKIAFLSVFYGLLFLMVYIVFKTYIINS